MEVICLDTNVLIEILKNNKETLAVVSRMTPPLFISSISAMELIYGARNKAEVKKLQAFIDKFEIMPVQKESSTLAFKQIVAYAKSYGLDIPDALIAASCIVNEITLFTYNIKDFHFLPKLKLLEE